MTPTLPTAADLLPLLPELVLVGAAFALLMLDLFIAERHRAVTHRKGDRAGGSCHIAAGEYAACGSLFHRVCDDG